MIKTVGLLVTGCCLALVAACGSASKPVVAGPGGPRENPPTSCPSGESLKAGAGQSRDYVDAVRLNGRTYVSRTGAPGSELDRSKLGGQVATVRCSKYQHDSDRRSEPDWTDPGSTFVPDGGPIYAVAGVAVDCQVAAASMDGKLRLYTAQTPDRPANCPS